MIQQTFLSSRSSKTRDISLNKFSASELLRLASSICNLSSGNILMIGGGMVLPEVIGYKRLRQRSDDLDFVVNNQGLQKLSKIYEIKPASLIIPNIGEGSYYSVKDGITIALFHDGVKGYDISKEVFAEGLEVKTSQGVVNTIPHELNIALKIRRGASKTHIYSKDALDFASTIVGLSLNGPGFDYENWARYMSQGVCTSCNLTRGNCIESLEEGVKNLEKKYRATVSNAASHCKEYTKEICMK
ncbi:MAG: hypothetical protein ABIH72_03715 [archaeon]